DGEQWRRASVAEPSEQRLFFSYGIDVASITDPGFEAVPHLDFASPDLGGNGAGGAGLNGNIMTQEGITAHLTGVEWGPGSALWLRWVDPNDSGNDHGLAIDNFIFETSVGGVPAVSDESGSVTVPPAE